MWLDKHAGGTSFRFVWSAGEMGTSIGSDEDAVRQAADTLGHHLICRVTAVLDGRNRTVLTVEHFGLVVPQAQEGV
jgi:hypothetical protein